MVREFVEPKQYVVDDKNTVNWGLLCRQAEYSVHRGKRPQANTRKKKKLSMKARLILWLAEQLAGGVAGVVAFATVWDTLEGSVEGQIRIVLAAAPALAAWVIMVLLIRWAPTNKLAFLLDR